MKRLAGPRTRRSRRVWIAVALSVRAGSAIAQGHGPAFGLSTPTLGRGDWSLDIGVMGRFVEGAHATMLRTMVSYGITADLQVSASLPLPLDSRSGVPPARGFARMPSSPDMEWMVGWRFDREGIGIGARRESTLWLGLDYPTDAVRGGVRTAPGIVAGAVTGYASRSVYIWGGALYRRYMSVRGPETDHPGDAALATLVLGYRPPGFRDDVPHPDWRVFLELLGEHTARDRIMGVVREDAGGRQALVALTVLGLYGSWGVSGGPAVPIVRRMNGVQPRERARFIVNTTFWF
ncbi:MAG: hypothetical protein L0271_01165 [Gemmatimonadetes bacterium]|nr:hypothetical protein [Gemmatimonadota bacterium]